MCLGTEEGPERRGGGDCAVDGDFWMVIEGREGQKDGECHTEYESNEDINELLT